MTALTGKQGSEDSSSSSSSTSVPDQPPLTHKAGTGQAHQETSVSDAQVADMINGSTNSSSLNSTTPTEGHSKKSSIHSSRASSRRSRIKSVRLPKNIQPDGVMGALAATILADSSNPSDDPSSSSSSTTTTLPSLSGDSTSESGHRRGVSADPLAGSKKLKRRSASYDRRRSGNFNGLQLSQAFGDEASFQALAASLGGKLGALTTTASTTPQEDPKRPPLPSNSSSSSSSSPLHPVDPSSSSPPPASTPPHDPSRSEVSDSPSSFPSPPPIDPEDPISPTTSPPSDPIPPEEMTPIPLRRRRSSTKPIRMKHSQVHASMENLFSHPLSLSRASSHEAPTDLPLLPPGSKTQEASDPREKPLPSNDPVPPGKDDMEMIRGKESKLEINTRERDRVVHSKEEGKVVQEDNESNSNLASPILPSEPSDHYSSSDPIPRRTPLSSLARRLPSARPPSFTLLRRNPSASSTSSSSSSISSSSSSSSHPISPTSPTSYNSKSLPARKRGSDPQRTTSPPLARLPSKPSLNSLFSESKNPSSLSPSSSTPDLHASSRRQEEKGKKLGQRQMVIRELVESEASYLKDLDVLDEVYYQGFRSKGLLRPGDLRLIFAHLNDIRSFSHTFLLALQAVTSRDLPPTPSEAPSPSQFPPPPPSSQETLAQCFSRLMPQMHRVYNDFCSKQDKVNARVDILKADPGIALFLQECQGKLKGRTTSWDLGSLLIKPVQRVLKYPLLVHAIIKATDPSDPEHASLTQTSLDLQRMADHINEVKRRRDVVERVIGKHIILGGPGVDKDGGSSLGGPIGMDGEGKSVDGRTRGVSSSISGMDRAGVDGDGKDQRGMTSRVPGRGGKRIGKRKGTDRSDDSSKSGDLRHRLREKRREAKAERKARQELGRADSGLDGMTSGYRGGSALEDGTEPGMARLLTVFEQQRAHGRQLIRDTEAWAASARLFLRAQCSFSSSLELFYAEDSLDLGGSIPGSGSGDLYNSSSSSHFAPRMGGGGSFGSGSSGSGGGGYGSSGGSFHGSSDSGHALSTAQPGISMMYVGGGGLSSWAGEYRRRMILGSEEMWSRLDEALQGEIFPALEHTYMGIFAAPERVIRRRAYRLPDYRKWRDATQGSSSSSSSTTLSSSGTPNPSTTSTSGHSVSASVKAGAEEYMALNSTLLEELPKLFALTTELLAVLVCSIGRLQQGFYQEWYAGMDEVRSGMIRDGYCFPGSAIGGGGGGGGGGGEGRKSEGGGRLPKENGPPGHEDEGSSSKGPPLPPKPSEEGKVGGGIMGGPFLEGEGPERKIMARSVVKESYQKAMAGEFGVLAMFTGLNVINGNWRHMGNPRMTSPPPHPPPSGSSMSSGIKGDHFDEFSGGKAGRILGTSGMIRSRKVSNPSFEPPPIPPPPATSSRSHGLDRTPTQRRIVPPEIKNTPGEVVDSETEDSLPPDDDDDDEEEEEEEEGGKGKEAEEEEKGEEEEEKGEGEEEGEEASIEAELDGEETRSVEPTSMRPSMDSSVSWDSQRDSLDGARTSTDEGNRVSIEETGQVIVEGNRRVTRTRSTLWEDGEKARMIGMMGDEEDPRRLSHSYLPPDPLSPSAQADDPSQDFQEGGPEGSEEETEPRVDDISAYQLPTPIRLPDRVSLGLGPESSFMGGKMEEFLQMDRPTATASRPVSQGQSARSSQALPPMPPVPPEHMSFKENGGSSLVSRSNSIRTGASSRVVSTTFSELGMDAEMLASYVGISEEAANAYEEMRKAKEEEEEEEDGEEEEEEEEEATDEEYVEGEEEELQYLFVCQVSFPFQPMEGSGELALKRTGDLIGVWRVDEESQWWYGVDLKDGESGWFPATYCQRVDLVDGVGDDIEEEEGDEDEGEEEGRREEKVRV
ncbi:MAG: hypothetical protein DHS80DRAFT_24806 [Piptocephalis tieghemiana]|nr:MAG: hypothetical protein DHS80DRAFT_24806 [Piptocephalis tieghemiana]